MIGLLIFSDEAKFCLGKMNHIPVFDGMLTLELFPVDKSSIGTLQIGQN